MSRGSHWDSRVAAEQVEERFLYLLRWLSLRARVFVADLFLYIDMWRLSRAVVAPTGI